MERENVLITGAAGFLGSHLCEKFLNLGYCVIGIDNLITGNMKNIEHLFEVSNNFEFIEQDICDPIKIEKDLKYILHFASPASPVDYMRFPIETLRVGSIGAYNVLELAKSKKSRILIASTSEVYGDPDVHPQEEEYWGNVNPIGPRSVYDEAKRFQESITMAYNRYYGVETRIARIFNTYGPGMRLDDGRALPQFVSQALKDQDLTVFGDGNQTRSFCYVDDLVEGIYRLLLSDYSYPMNIGNPEEVTIKQFAEEIIELTGSYNKIQYKSLPQDDPKKRNPDITKAKNILGWEPVIKRAEGLKKTLEHFKRLSDERKA